MWKIPVATGAILLLLLLWKFPPRKLFYTYDRQTLRFARWVHRQKTTSSSPAPLEIHIPEFSQPAYDLHFSPEANSVLDELPFETFDRIRERAIDLSYDPHPKSAQLSPRRPGAWFFTVSGYRLTYRINDPTKNILVEAVEKI
jgi:mRNA-degrading endonuclease RelE of RelBE toxin-antitoxin system